jgi:hypothetical protein
MDDGWTRWVFDKYRVPFTQITEKDLAAGSLNAKFDAIVIPDQSAAAARPRIGDAGSAALGAFVEGAETSLRSTTHHCSRSTPMKLPVKNVLEGVKNTDFYAPGSIFGVEVNKSSPLAAGLTTPVPSVWFEDGPAFDIHRPGCGDRGALVPSERECTALRLLLGPQKLNGKAAMVDVKRGRGHVVLYGFRPQYRGQSNATFPLIWAAIGKPAA